MSDEKNKQLMHVDVCFFHDSGDSIKDYNFNETLSVIIPDVGDVVEVGGVTGEVSKKHFKYGNDSMQVMIYIKEE